MPGIGLPDIRQSQNVVHTGVIKTGQRDQSRRRHVQISAYIIGIGRLADVQDLGQIFLTVLVLYAAAQLTCQGGPPVFPFAALIQTLLLLTTVPAIAPRDTEDSLL